jgi:hypothetical protein
VPRRRRGSAASRFVGPAGYTSPSLAAVTPKIDPGAAMRISQAAAISVPSAHAVAGDRGDRRCPRVRQGRLGGGVEFPEVHRARTLRSAMSEPAEKCPPAPVITSAPIESSASTFAMICGSARHMGREIALRFSVRSMTRVPTPPETVKSKPSRSTGRYEPSGLICVFCLSRGQPRLSGTSRWSSPS